MPVFLLAISAVIVSASEFDHSAWDRVLKRHVNALGEVDYAALKAAPADLDAYVMALAQSSPDNRKDAFPARQSELAYWINAYNALAVKAVVKAYPVHSVRDLGMMYGFFRRKEHKLGGTAISLHALEDDILRARYKDPRIHFAIVCASASCPLLDRDAFQGATLDAHLDRVTRRFLGESRNVEIDGRSNTASLSAIFEWYGKDFGPLPDYLARYGVTLPAKTRIRYRPYDWSLNGAGSRGRRPDSWP